ncbi:MAG: helix-turn-helix domain-containing protein [Prevotella sp.]|nr:helix-turn-helix domain-containing protein [Prevotella sp.]
MTALSLGNFELNVQKQQLLFHASDGTQVLRKLSFREASILRLLVEAQGDVVENDILLNEFWSGDSIYNLNALYVFMSRLKRLLAADPSLSIVNARGIGYRLVLR